VTRIGQVGVLVLGSVLVGAGIWYGIAHRSNSGQPLVAESIVAARDMPPRDATATDGVASVAPQGKETSQIADYSAAFRRAANYRQFISDSLPAARAGNPDAQYYVSAAMKYCTSMHALFKRRNRTGTLSLEEALESWESIGARGAIDSMRRAEGRCRDIWEKPDLSWENAEVWLARAAESGQPVAQVLTAQEMIFQRWRAGQQKTANIPKPDDPQDMVSYKLSEDELKEPRALVSAALATRNPEAMARIGDLAYQLDPGKPDVDEKQEFWVWLYAACVRGLDCSGEAEWRREICSYEPDCVPSQEGLEFLRQLAPRLDLLNLEARAYALNDKIDQGHWSALGLGL